MSTNRIAVLLTTMPGIFVLLRLGIALRHEPLTAQFAHYVLAALAGVK